MKLIDKAAVVAEIERVLNSYHPTEITSGRYALANLRKFLDTLEVKEVDLEKEIEQYVSENGLKDYGFLIPSIAQYFFELALKQSSCEFKLGESEIYLEDDGGEPPYDGKQWLDISCMEYAIPYDKFKDGDKIEIVIRKIKKGE